MTVLLHKIALVNVPMVTTVINNLVSELNERWSNCTNEEDPFWKFCDQNGIKKSTYRGNALEGPQTLLLLEVREVFQEELGAKNLFQF